MKKILVIAMIFMCVSISGCNVFDSSVAETEEPFKKIYQDSDVVIYVDTETKVMYASHNNGHGGTAFEVLVDQDGKPRLYEENEHDGE